MSDDTPPRYPRHLGTVGTVVDEWIRPLQAGYLADRSDAVAMLAKLRRGAGKPLAAVPEVWGLTCDPRLSSPGVSAVGDASRQEQAAHIAVTLYALHQQSRRPNRMHVPGVGLGQAVRKALRRLDKPMQKATPQPDVDKPLRRRLVAAGSAHTVDGLAARLREVVSQLRQAEVGLDYAVLADQLERAQRPGGMNEVRLAWGRGFHASQQNTEAQDEREAE